VGAKDPLIVDENGGYSHGDSLSPIE